jgi:hypothetical protein
LLEESVKRTHEPTNPGAASRKSSRTGKDQSTMSIPSGQMLLMQRQIIDCVLGDQGSTLSSSPPQYFRIIAPSELWKVRDGHDVMSPLLQLIGNRGRKMLV